MIFPGFDTEYWCKKHNLKVAEVKCPNCGRMQQTTVPFITKEYVGLIAPIHECGSDWQAGSVAPRDIEDRDLWANLVADSIGGHYG